MCPPGKTEFFFSCHLMQTHSDDYESEDIYNPKSKKRRFKYISAANQFKQIKNVEIYQTMTLKKTYLRRMNYV